VERIHFPFAPSPPFPFLFWEGNEMGGIVKRLRQAACEITGGHHDSLNQAWEGSRTTHVRLQCSRCGRLTKWHKTSIPTAPTGKRNGLTRWRGAFKDCASLSPKDTGGEDE